MELYEAMRCAPATRRFTSAPVPRELLMGVLDHARYAPSGGNRQGWSVVAVQDAHTRRVLRDLYQVHWRAYMQRSGGEAMLAHPERFAAARVRMVQRAEQFAERLHEIPLHLVIGVRLDDLAITDAQLERPSIVGGASIYPFVQNILLGLRAEGLGAALTTLLVAAEAEVRPLLDLPDDVALAGLIAVGYRDDPWPRRLSRRAVEEFAFSERFGVPLTSA